MRQNTQTILQYDFIPCYACQMTTQTSRQLRKSELRQQSLVDEAKYLFITQGYAGTTIDDIVEKADVAKVTFYAYFKSKEEIALRVKRESTEEALFVR